MKKFYAIEIIDVEGDCFIRHVWMTVAEAQDLTLKLAFQGIKAILHDLTSPQANEADGLNSSAVLSGDVISRVLGPSS